MEATLITTGLICLVAAIVGGGLKGLGFEFPALQSTRRQVLLAIFGFLLLTVSQAGRIAEYLGSLSSPALMAPMPLTPVCGAVTPVPKDGSFLAFTWSKVEKASTYTVEVDCFGCSGRRWFSASGQPWHVRPGLGMRTELYSSNLYEQLRREGGYAIRWRVWAVDHSGKAGKQSEWCQVAFVGSATPPTQ